MLDGGHDHRHWCWTSQPPAAPPPQSCREQKFNCTSTHSSKHHALPRWGGEGEEGKRTVVAIVLADQSQQQQNSPQPITYQL